MTELKRPASIRELVDQLPRTALLQLCELRGQPTSRANDDCRNSISRSFRGRRDEFLEALRKEDLLLLMRMPIRDGDSVYELPNAYSFAKRELLELAVVAFGRIGDLGKPFVLRTRTYPGTPNAPPPTTANEVDDGLAHSEANGAAPAAAGGGWSRLRPLRALFSQVGLPVPSEMTQEDFGALLETLELRGFEVSTASCSRLTPLHDAVPLDAELRLRHDALAAPASLRSPHEDRGAQSGEGAFAELGDYERASLRLEVLTAGLGPGQGSPEQSAKTVEIAVAGLAINSAERVLLTTVGEALARTLRDPIVVITGLVRRLDAEDGEVLLREYAAIYPRQDELHVLLANHWAALCTRRSGGRADAAIELDRSDADAVTRNE